MDFDHPQQHTGRDHLHLEKISTHSTHLIIIMQNIPHNSFKTEYYCD